MTEPSKRRRRGESAKTTQVVSDEIPAPKDLYCSRCGYHYGDMGDVEQTSAELAHVSGVKFECPECDYKGVPVLEPKKKDPIEAPFVPKPITTIINSIFKMDYGEEFQRLRDNLTVGDGRTDYGTVNMALDRAQDNAFDAYNLFLSAKRDYERYTIDRKIIWATMRDEAHAILQAEKKAGDRNKTITDDDVQAKMAELHPDEFRHVEMQEREFKLAVDAAENLSERWAKKSADLNTMLHKLKG